MNVLIVDDQERIVKATKKLVNWEKLGVEQVFTALSAHQAQEVMQKERVDILLTDIEMPGEDGIALQKWQAEHFPETACIFLTSHADFSYAKEAIRGGAFDYILQPAAIPEIESVIGRCIASLAEKRNTQIKSRRYDARREELLRGHLQAMFQRNSTYVDMKRWRADSGTEEEDWWFIPSITEVYDKESGDVLDAMDRTLQTLTEPNENVHFLICELDRHTVGTLCYGRADAYPVQKNKELYGKILELTERSCGCALNMTVGAVSGDALPQAIAETAAFREKRLLERHAVYFASSGEVRRLSVLREPDRELWTRWLLRGDTYPLQNQFNNLLATAQQEEQLTVDYAASLLHAFLEALSVACYEQKGNVADLFDGTFSYEQMLESMESAEKLKAGAAFCIRRYEELYGTEETAQREATPAERVRQIKRYLGENIDRPVSRREAAKYLFLNEDYFSRMFQKETGMSYRDYVLQLKSGYAAKLLEESDLPVTLIASKVGYDNFANFTRMFTKVKGVSPSEYRKQYQVGK